jgi:hypothetical protein
MMGLDRNQAIGRAQRQGRVDQLHIHNLYYSNEMQITQQNTHTQQNVQNTNNVQDLPERARSV